MSSVPLSISKEKPFSLNKYFYGHSKADLVAPLNILRLSNTGPTLQCKRWKVMPSACIHDIHKNPSL